MWISRLFGTLLFFQSFVAFCQIEQYNYTRKLKGVSEQWHRIILPNNVLEKVSNELNDLRIFGVTKEKDTIEVPYLLQFSEEKTTRKEIVFKRINSTHNDHGYYFTFEIPSLEIINQIKLDFKQTNFDWRIKIEGSNNQNGWFTLNENYRILAIKNEVSDFQSATLTFPSSKFRYYRLLILTNEQPELEEVSISKEEKNEGTIRNYTIQKFKTQENREGKYTELLVDLNRPVHANALKINVKEIVDFYRPITIKYLSDSIKTEHGWKYNYTNLASGTFNSIDKDRLTFDRTKFQKLKIIIFNQDNEPLTIESLEVAGYEIEMLARFTQPAQYYLVYGNENATKPNYDIVQFSDKIPQHPAILSLDTELPIEKVKQPKQEPIFKNQMWLWIIMAIVIIVLGWFSLKMMRKS